MDAVRVVGPRQPATKRGRPLDRSAESAALRAIRGGRKIDLRHAVLKTVVGLRRGVGGEAVGDENVGAGMEVGVMDAADCVRLGQAQQIVVALERMGPIRETLSPVFLLGQVQRLRLRSERAVQDENSAAEQSAERIRPGCRTAHAAVTAVERPRASQMASVSGARFIV